jgi:hypothetical protein
MKVTVDIATENQDFPAGTVAGDWRVVAISGDDPDAIAAELVDKNPKVTFDLADGEYHFRAQRLDAEGNAIGPTRKTPTVIVGSGLVPVDVPLTLDVKVG